LLGAASDPPKNDCKLVYHQKKQGQTYIRSCQIGRSSAIGRSREHL